MQGFIPFIVIYILLAAWIIGTVFRFRERLAGMAGMTAAMALGMGMGLGFGSLIAAWIPGNFALTTALGMAVGGTIGAVTGIPIGMMAVLDGLLSGIMAGMMGTMLTEMMPPGEVELTVQWMVVVYSVIIFILFLMLHQTAHPSESKTSLAFWLRPVTMFLVVLIIILFTLQHDLVLRSELVPPSVHSH